jgi:outer membrane protein assembly factor BamD (BamD/ComL family)
MNKRRLLAPFVRSNEADNPGSRPISRVFNFQLSLFNCLAPFIRNAGPVPSIFNFQFSTFNPLAFILMLGLVGAVYGQDAAKPAARRVAKPAAKPAKKAGADRAAKMAKAGKLLDALVAKAGMDVALSAEDMRKALIFAAYVGRPHSVEPTVKTFLAQTSKPSAELLKRAAENAWLAGDYGSATVRQKLYVLALTDKTAASKAAGRLYDMLFTMGDTKAITAFMKMNGASLRATPAARKFDRLYLDQAWERQDLPAVARWLSLCLSDTLPLAQEQELFWGDLDRLIESTRLDDGKAYRALPDMRRLADLIRENPARAAQLRFQAETLGFNAGARGKEAAQLETDFAPVAAAAKAWFDAAPSGATLRSICRTWSGGFPNDSYDQWRRGQSGKQTFYKESFARLSDEERVVAVDGRCATSATWLELIKTVPPSPARNRWAVRVPLQFKSKDLAAYQALAPALAGIESRDAAIIRSVAAGEVGYSAMLTHLAEKESWMFSAEDLMRKIPEQLKQIDSAFPRNRNERPERAYARYIADVLLKSPIPLMVDNRHLLGSLWRDGDRAKMPEYLHRLDWVPLSADQRAQAFKDIEGDFRRWSDSVRRQEGAARNSPEKKKQWDAQIALVKRIDQTFKQVMDPKVFDASKAPSPLLGHLAKMNQGDKAAALAAARQAYALVRDFDEKKLPFGAVAFDAIVRKRGESDAWDIQAEVYGNQLLRLALTGRSQHGRVPIRWHGMKAELRTKVAASVAKATLAMLNAGKFNGAVFDIYRQVRADNASSRAIFSKLVEDKVLLKHPGYQVAPTSTRRDDRRTNAATKYQWLLGREFQWMNDKYPRDSYFDDIFAEEVSKTGLADPMFWRESGDKSRKGANAVAAAFKGLTKAPFGYDGSKPAYRPGDFWAVAAQAASRADAGPRNAMLVAAEAAYGKTRFDDYALGKARLDSFDPKAPNARKQWFDQLKTVLDRAATQPRQVSMPSRLGMLKTVRGANNITDAELALLVRMFDELTPWGLDSRDYGEAVLAGIDLVQDGLLKRGRSSELLSLPPAFCALTLALGKQSWVITSPFVAKIKSFAKADQLPLAVTYSSATQRLLRKVVDGGALKELETIRTMALLKLGGAGTTVAKGDSRYDIYAAQRAYKTGKHEEAWRHYAEAGDVLAGELSKLDPKFLFWVAGEAIRRGANGEAQRVTRLMMSAHHKGDVILTEVEDRANLDLLYADIAKAGEQYPLAKSQYERIVLNKDYAGTQTKVIAQLRIAEVLRLTADYGGAETVLAKLRESRDKEVAAKATYMSARIKADQNQYGAARELVEETVRLNPNAVEAKLLEGELNLKTGKLPDATQLDISDLSTGQRVLVPGRSLTVQIEDRNLSVVGKNNAIEVRVMTTGGDLEVFNLLPFGDSKTKFSGRIASELGAPAKQDNILQVLGGDKVYYDFSKRFRQANKMPLQAKLSEPVTVLSDSQFSISSGNIVVTAERDAGLRLEALARKAQHDDLRSADRKLDEIKPGNPINVRVIDPDQSTTTETDSVTVTATASSGDTVKKLLLAETDPVSGVFAGELKTGAAPAAAQASESNVGSDPAFAISGGEHPPWVALADNKRPKQYTVDMNDRAALKSLSILADVPGRGLKKFAVQTSLTGGGFKTVGAWPTAVQPWDGSMQMTVMRFGLARSAEWQDEESRGKDAKASQAAESKKMRVVRDFMTFGGLGPDNPSPVVLPGTPSATLDQGFRNSVKTVVSGGHHDHAENWFVLHLRGGFYLDSPAERTIQASVKDVRGHVLVVNGQVAPVDEDSGQPMLTQYFEKGAHSIDYYLWATAWHGKKPGYSIEWDIPEAPFFAPIPAEQFDVTMHPEISKKLTFTPATVTPVVGNKTFDVTFAENMEARLVRLALLDFEGDAPALRKLTAHDTQDRKVLPTEMDLLALRNNDVLETNPGDTITISYEDPTPIAPANRIRSDRMKATYTTAKIGAYIMEVEQDVHGRSVRKYTTMRRFRPGHVVNVFVYDPDADVSGERDTVPLKVRTSAGTEVEIKALESPSPRKSYDTKAEHTGWFLARVFPVEGVPQREGEVQLLPDDGLTITYLDRENMDKGIPWERSTFVEQAGQGVPVLRGFDVETAELPEAQRIETPAQLALKKGAAQHIPGNEMGAALKGEFVPVLRTLMSEGRESADNDKTAAAPILSGAAFEVTWPAIALSGSSEVAFFAQSYASRRLADVTDPTHFDPEMPGTVPLKAKVGGGSGQSAPPGYARMAVRYADPADRKQIGRDKSPMDLGLFRCSVPLVLGDPSTMTFEERAERTREAEEARSDRDRGEEEFVGGGVPLGAVPVLGTNDGVVIGFPYSTDVVAYEEGELGTNWIVRHYTLFSDPFLDVMDKAFSEPLRTGYMGETAYLRVIDPAGDVSGDKDTIKVMVQAAESEPVSIDLMEVFPHAGVFKGTMEIVTKEEAETSQRPGIVGAEYGDELVVSYTGGSDRETLKRSFEIEMGADGLIQSFTRSFKDQSIAVQTQFTVAESYFELAKSHRELKQNKLADQETAQGRKLLEEAIRDFPDNDAKAQAEYLLGELALELSYATDDEKKKRELASDALARFSDVALAYPDSPYAPKAQFKKALTLEKVGQLTPALEEYVKLAYKYPDHKLVAETIARIGNYFLAKGKELQRQKGAATTEAEAAKVAKQMVDMYVTAGDVLRRLAPRFPGHKLATKTTVLGAQSYMRAEKYRRAIRTFEDVMEGDRRDGEVVAEAMYWCAESHMKIAAYEGPDQRIRYSYDEQKAARYRALKVLTELTWDYPESQWAKYARGKMADEMFNKMSL